MFSKSTCLIHNILSLALLAAFFSPQAGLTSVFAARHVDEKLPAPKTSLDDYAVDLSEMVRTGRVGRNERLASHTERLIAVLTAESQQIPLLISDDRGLSIEVVEQAALVFFEKNFAEKLSQAQIVLFDTASAFSRFRTIGGSRMAFRSLISARKQDRDLIVFVDDLTLFINAGLLASEIAAAA
ncbi:MAG: hypothetical protein C4325_11170, partial [Blastocatellia bacterium]